MNTFCLIGVPYPSHTPGPCPRFAKNKSQIFKGVNTFCLIRVTIPLPTIHTHTSGLYPRVAQNIAQNLKSSGRSKLMVSKPPCTHFCLTCMYCSAAFLSLSCAAANWMLACCSRSDNDRSTRSLDDWASFRLFCNDSIWRRRGRVAEETLPDSS